MAVRPAPSLLTHLTHLFLLLFCVDYGHALPLTHTFLSTPPPPPLRPPPPSKRSSSSSTTTTHLTNLPPTLTIPGLNLNISGPIHISIGSHLINASSPSSSSSSPFPRSAKNPGTELSYGSTIVAGGSLCSFRKLAPGAFADHAEEGTVKVYYGSTRVDNVDVEHVATDAEGRMRFDGSGRPVMKVGFEGEAAWAGVACRPLETVDPTVSNAVPGSSPTGSPTSGSSVMSVSLPTSSVTLSLATSGTALSIDSMALLTTSSTVPTIGSMASVTISGTASISAKLLVSMTTDGSSSSFNPQTTLSTMDSSLPAVALVTIASSTESSTTSTSDTATGNLNSLITIPTASTTVPTISNLMVSQVTSTFTTSSPSPSSSSSSVGNSTATPLPLPNSHIHSLNSHHVSRSTHHALSKILPGVVIGSALLGSGILGIFQYFTSHPDKIGHATRLVRAYSKGYQPFDQNMWQRFWDTDLEFVESSRASSVWTGEFSIPPVGETWMMSGGSSQLDLPNGQAVEAIEGTVIRAEEAGMIVAETQGAIEVCQGICGEVGSVEPPIEMPPGGRVDIVINSTPEGIREFTEVRLRKTFRMNFRGGNVAMRMPGGRPYRITNTPYNPSDPVSPATEALPSIDSKPAVQDPVPQEAPNPVVQSPVPQEAPKPEVQPPSQQTEIEPSNIKAGKTQYDPVTGEPPWLKHVPYHPLSNPNTEKSPAPVLKPVLKPASPPSNPESNKFEKPTLKPVNAPPKSPIKDPQSGKFEKPPLKPVDSPAQPPAKDPKAGKFEKPTLRPVDSPTKPSIKDPKSGKFEKPPLKPIPKSSPSNPGNGKSERPTLKPVDSPAKPPAKDTQPGKFDKPPLKPVNTPSPANSPPTNPQPSKFEKPTLKPADTPPKPTGKDTQMGKFEKPTLKPAANKPPSPSNPGSGKFEKPPLKPIDGPKKYDHFSRESQRRSESEGKSVIRFRAWNETQDGVPPPEVGEKPVMTLLEFVGRVMKFQEGEGKAKAAEAA